MKSSLFTEYIVVKIERVKVDSNQFRHSAEVISTTPPIQSPLMWVSLNRCWRDILNEHEAAIISLADQYATENGLPGSLQFAAVGKVRADMSGNLDSFDLIMPLNSEMLQGLVERSEEG